jgi:hypothetical protein
MLETNPIEFHSKIENFIFIYITFGHERVDVVSVMVPLWNWSFTMGPFNNLSFTSF